MNGHDLELEKFHVAESTEYVNENETLVWIN